MYIWVFATFRFLEFFSLDENDCDWCFASTHSNKVVDLHTDKTVFYICYDCAHRCV